MSTVEVRGPSGALRGSCRMPGRPPWWLFSGRWPWVSTPGTSTLVTNGSAPPAGVVVIATGMIAIDSYHEVVLGSYVPDTDSTSPCLTATRQLRGVAVIDTSHETGPAGSK